MSMFYTIIDVIVFSSLAGVLLMLAIALGRILWEIL